jgi:hypothetical protein
MTTQTYARADITDWRPEDDNFWNSGGKSVAYRNLWISIPNLLVGFAVWGMWGMITVQMLNLGFPFKPADMFTLTAIAGLMGATMRIPASFFIRLSGGRNTIFLTSTLLIIPAVWTGIALQDKNTPLWVFQACAFLSGIGGRQLCLLDVQHLQLLSQAPAGHRTGSERGPGQLRRHHHAGADPAGDDGRRVRRRGWRLDGAAQGQRLDSRQDRGRHAHLHPERGLHLGGHPGAPGSGRLVRHEQPHDPVAQLRRHAGGVCQDHLPVGHHLRGWRSGPVPVSSGARPDWACSTCGWRCL